MCVTLLQLIKKSKQKSVNSRAGLKQKVKRKSTWMSDFQEVITSSLQLDFSLNPSKSLNSLYHLCVLWGFSVKKYIYIKLKETP